jgi:L-serine dehydratase
MRRNERHWRSDAEIDAGLMKDLARDAVPAVSARLPLLTGVLAGRLQGQAPRGRACNVRLDLEPRGRAARPAAGDGLVNLYALAVNEENAAGGRVVTAPTNGAAGIVPAVLHYYTRFVPGATETGVVDFLLTAAAIGILYKENASISGAEVGCQGEVGVACSMAAGACAR